jgi:hypothetical protein
MTGGTSALLQAQAADGLADELQRRLDDYRQMAENFRAAHASERRLEQTLAPLRNHGYQVLADRRWPGSRNAQVDFLVVGPSGVFIVDAKSWRDVRVERSESASTGRSPTVRRVRMKRLGMPCGARASSLAPRHGQVGVRNLVPHG